MKLPVLLRTALAVWLTFVGDCCSGNDLLRLYDLAQRHDATLQAAFAQRDVAIEVHPQALSQLLPQLTATGQAGRERIGEEVAEIQTAAVGGTGLSGTYAGCGVSAESSMLHCTGDQHGYGATLSQTLWSFASFNRLREANAQVGSAQATLVAARQDLILRVAQAYFTVLAARDQLATNRAERDGYGALLNQARGRLQTGVGPRSDVEEAQSYFDSTEQGVIDAGNALDDAQLALTELTGADARNLAVLRDDIPLQPPQPASIEEWVSAAQRDNPQIRAAVLAVDAAERDIAAQQGRALPALTLTGSTTRTFERLTVGGNSSDDVIGVAVNWPLFQGGAVASAMRQSRALYREAEAGLAAIQRDTERLTRAAYRNVVTGIERIGAARHSMDSGNVAVEASRRNIQFGTGSEFELLSNQGNYFVAQRLYSQTRYDYLTALLTLQQQAGRLSADDLKAIDDLLVAAAPP